MTKTVLVVGKDHFVEKMFLSRGYEVHVMTNIENDIPSVDLVVFTGGADLNPKLYGEKPNGAIGWNDQRDQFEIDAWNKFTGEVPVVGICRGAQFLCVMNGGKLEQHHSGHSGDHLVMYILGGKVFTNKLRECHHQCLLPNGKNEVDYHVLGRDVRDENIEIVFFPKFKQLAFQAHPEWGHKETEDLFFDLLEEHLGLMI